ncbi:MAG: helix-turn-helix transcriptional regulator [Acidimicrobiales bacterium]
MHIHNLSTDEWEARLGVQIRELRLRLNLTQAEVARRSNIDRTTVGRIESGEGGSVSSLVRIARALGRDNWLESFAPTAPMVSPMQQLRERQRLEGQRRQRAGPSTEVS